MRLAGDEQSLGVRRPWPTRCRYLDLLPPKKPYILGFPKSTQSEVGCAFERVSDTQEGLGTRTQATKCASTRSALRKHLWGLSAGELRTSHDHQHMAGGCINGSSSGSMMPRGCLCHMRSWAASVLTFRTANNLFFF